MIESFVISADVIRFDVKAFIVFTPTLIFEVFVLFDFVDINRQRVFGP